MASIRLNNNIDVSGLTLIELMISMAISVILGIAVLTIFTEFYRNGAETSDLDQRIGNAAVMQSVATHFLTRAGFPFSGAPTVSTLPVVTQPGGLTIQWNTPSLALCDGTLQDTSLSMANGVQVSGVEWTAKTMAGSAGSCGDGTAFFPIDDHWQFALVYALGCQNSPVVQPPNPNAVAITSSYAYGMNNQPGVSGTPNTQTVTVCLPNT